MKTTMILLVAAFVTILSPAAWAANFTDNGDATVTDADTGLMWQQTEGGSMGWEAALTYCEGLGLAGYTDWRLPNIKELESIVDDTKSISPVIDSAAFPNANAAGYWSSTTYFYDESDAWGVNFGDGYVDDYNKAGTSYVRCVR